VSRLERAVERRAFASLTLSAPLSSLPPITLLPWDFFGLVVDRDFAAVLFTHTVKAMLSGRVARKRTDISQVALNATASAARAVTLACI
jgi:hypothetical protein